SASGAINAARDSFRFLVRFGYAADTAALAAGSLRFAVTITGVKTGAGNGDIDLVNQAGTLTLAQPVSAGTGTVRVNSATAVTQTSSEERRVGGTELAGGGSERSEQGRGGHAGGGKGGARNPIVSDR